MRRTLTTLAVVALAAGALAQDDRFEQLANLPMDHNRPTGDTARTLEEEMLFQRACQTYLWAMPLLNTMGMRDGFDESFGSGYNVMGIWTKRLDARTRITTPNSDLIYGMVFADLGDTGPLVFEAPAGLQGILLDFWQRPIPVDGGEYFGDLGLPGPDQGKGGKFLLVPPGYEGDIPEDHYVYRSGTNNVFIFLRSFYKSLDNIEPATDALKQSVFYPLGKKSSAKPMVFKDASTGGHEMLPPSDFSAFERLKWLLDAEGAGLADPDWLGMLAGLGIVEGEPFEPTSRQRAIMDAAARTAYKTTRVLGMKPEISGVDFRVYDDRTWLNPVNNLDSRYPDAFVGLDWTDSERGYTNLDMRAWFFTDYYSISPGMVSMTPGKGAFYMIAFKDSNDAWLDGEHEYTLHLPPNIPAGLFWSVTLYEAENASGLANGQPFPSLGKLNEPVPNDDGSIDLYFGPSAPEGKEKNWMATPEGRGYFAVLRLYGPTEPALDGSWKPGDFEKAN